MFSGGCSDLDVSGDEGMGFPARFDRFISSYERILTGMVTGYVSDAMDSLHIQYNCDLPKYKIRGDSAPFLQDPASGVQW
jgi:hypothetical protein